jgi:anti-anti-sigma regulatory factor
MAKKRGVVSASNPQNNAAEMATPVHAKLVLEGALDIAGAAELRERLLQALDGKQSVVVDAANVERVDTAALQVLTAFFIDAVAQNMDVRWQECSQVFKDAVRLLGLHDTLTIH